jgi:hypothetical protein
LAWGTLSENTRDRHRHGSRWLRGEEVGHSKLSERKVRDIQQRLAGGESTVVLGREYGVTRQAIRHIATGRNWKSIVLEAA